MLWTEEAVEILKRLAREGRSASVIALALGAPSRNAVIGKANRIGIRLNGDGRAPSPGSARAGAHRPPTAVPSSRPHVWPRKESAATRSYSEAEIGDMPR